MVGVDGEVAALYQMPRDISFWGFMVKSTMEQLKVNLPKGVVMGLTRT